MPPTTKIRKQGAAAVMTLPIAVLKMAKLSIGEEVSLLVENGRLIIAPARRRRLTMSELLKGSDVIKKLTAETAWAREGIGTGREIG